MTQTRRFTSLVLLAIALFVASSPPRPAQAGAGDTALALAVPLAEQFGVPAGAITSLIKKGVSLDSVTELLLIAQSSGKAFDYITDLYRKSKNDVAAVARKLDVDPKDYSQEQVNAALDRAKSQAQADAADKAADEARDAVGSAWKGWKR